MPLLRSSRIALLAAGALGLVLVLAPSARAHSFLVRTDPAQGSRLADAPETIALQFSEPVVVANAYISISDRQGGEIEPVDMATESENRVLRIDLPDMSDGVFVVSWHVVSAIDGHEEAGEFAFAVGQTTGSVPESSHGSPIGRTILDAVATWVFVIGLAGAAGAAATRRYLVPTSAVIGAGAVRAGLLLALAGVAGRYALDMTGGAAGSSDPVRWYSTATVALMALAMLALRNRPGEPLAMVLAGVATVTWAARGHLAAAAGWRATMIDILHLWAAALWLGALGWVTYGLWRDRSGPADSRMRWVTAYSQLATMLVVVLAAAGASAALWLLPDLAALWRDGYGRIVAAKTALFAGVVGVAWAARRALRRRDVVVIRRSIAVEVAMLVIVIGLSATLTATAPPLEADQYDPLLGPPPITGVSVRGAGLVGGVTVGYQVGDGRLDVVALTPGSDVSVEIEASVTLGDGRRVELVPRPCGSGCYTQQLRMVDGESHLRLAVTADGFEGGALTDLIEWPPVSVEPSELADIVDAMTAVASLEMTERVSSGPEATRTATFQLSGDQFVSTEPYAGGGVTDLRSVPGEGRAIGFYVPGSQMWFTLWVDSKDRIVREQIINRGHDIDRTFTYASG